MKEPALLGSASASPSYPLPRQLAEEAMEHLLCTAQGTGSIRWSLNWGRLQVCSYSCSSHPQSIYCVRMGRAGMKLGRTQASHIGISGVLGCRSVCQVFVPGAFWRLSCLFMS